VHNVLDRHPLLSQTLDFATRVFRDEVAPSASHSYVVSVRDQSLMSPASIAAAGVSLDQKLVAVSMWTLATGRMTNSSFGTSAV
jgi:hypothetical protein